MVWKTTLSVFFFFFFFFWDCFFFPRINFCDMQPILLDVFEYILDHWSTHFFGSVSFTPHCIAFQSTLVRLSDPIDASISLHLQGHWPPFLQPTVVSTFDEEISWRYFLSDRIFCGEDGKKRQKSQIFCNEEIRQDQCQDQFCQSSFATKEMKYV